MSVEIATIARIGAYNPIPKTIEIYFLVCGARNPIKVSVPADDAIEWPRFLQFVSSKIGDGEVTLHDPSRMKESWESKLRIIADRLPGSDPSP